jgi:large subunit ribosomal protein L13
MPRIQRKSFSLKPAEVNRGWYHIDASDLTLGKLAVRAANLLSGKNKPEYTPGVDAGDYVVVTNAGSVSMSGKKAEQKKHRYHTGHVGGLREITYGDLMETEPQKVIELAVRRMLPKNKLGREMTKRLKVYASGDHPHTAQGPETIGLSL